MSLFRNTHQSTPNPTYLEGRLGVLDVAIAVLAEVWPVGVLAGDAVVGQHPLVDPRVLAAVAAVVAEAPGAVDEGLLGELDEVVGMEEAGALKVAHGAEAPAGAADGLVLDRGHRTEETPVHAVGDGGGFLAGVGLRFAAVVAGGVAVKI